MDPTTLFHRSFLDVTQYARAAYDKPDTLIGDSHVDRQPVSGSTQGYQLLAKALRPVDLYPKPGQNFKLYATGWEQRCSDLIDGTSGTTLAPVVDSNRNPMGYPVIAHYGVVRAERIVVPRKYVHSLGVSIHSVAELVEQGIPAFVTNVDYPNVGGWGPLENGGVYRYTVLTDVEGAILAQLDSHLRDDSIVEADPFLYIALGSLLVDLGAAIGRRIV